MSVTIDFPGCLSTALIKSLQYNSESVEAHHLDKGLDRATRKVLGYCQMEALCGRRMEGRVRGGDQ